MASAKQNKEFTDRLLPNYPLDEAMERIKANLDPEEVFDKKELEEWAVNNGFVEDE